MAEIRMNMSFRSKAVECLLRFWSATKGATAVEAGLLSFPFIGVLAATFELGYVHVQNEILANAVARAGRLMMTGQVQANSQVKDATTFVNTYLCPSTGTRPLPTNFDCSKLIVDVRTATSFAATNMSNDIYKSATMFCPGKPGDIAIIRVAYPLGAILPLNLFDQSVGTVNDVPGSTGRYHILLGAAAFLEEPYATTYTQPTGC